MFSVVIPTFNRNALALRAAKSVLNCNSLVQIIIVDTNIVSSEEFKTDLWRLSLSIEYYHIGRANGSIARNFGSSKAKYDWLMFLDDDDTFLPQKLLVMTRYIDRHPDCSCFVSRSQVENAMYLKTERVFQGNFLSYFEHIFGDHKFNSSSIVIMKNLFVSLGGFDSVLIRLQDFDFLLRVLLESDVFIIEEFLQVLDKSDRQNLPSIHDYIRNQKLFLSKWFFLAKDRPLIYLILLSEFLTSFFFLSISKRSPIAFALSFMLNLIFFVNIPFLVWTVFRKLGRLKLFNFNC